MNESKFTDLVLDATSDYVAKTILSENDFSVKDCVSFIAEATDFTEADIESAFGDLISSELDRAIVARAAGIIESSAEKFSDTMLLKEEDVRDVSDNVDRAAKKQQDNTNNANAIQAQAALDKQKKGSHNRKYFAYVNLAKGGQVYICSERQEASGAISNAFSKLGNFLKTVTSPQFKYGILVAPISESEATNYLAASKSLKPGIKYLDLTKNQTGAEKAVRRNDGAADAMNRKGMENQQASKNSNNGNNGKDQ